MDVLKSEGEERMRVSQKRLGELARRTAHRIPG